MSRFPRAFLLVAAGVVVPPATAGRDTAAPAVPSPPNILLIIADDLGVDRVGCYDEHPAPGSTPVIDQLATDGVLFRNAWANPLCSPTRATMLTGRYSFRTGVGEAINWVDPKAFELPLEEVTLPEVLSPTYRTAVVGKWHLAAEVGAGPQHPLLSGFDHHLGSMASLDISDPLAYFAYEKSVDGVLVPSMSYATTETVDDALALIHAYAGHPAPTPIPTAPAMPESGAPASSFAGGLASERQPPPGPPEPLARPWFLWLAFNAPHKPLHVPPDHLHDSGVDDSSRDPELMKAVTEAMDTEIGRLLAGIPPEVRAETIVIFVGDNGTVASATTAPFLPMHAKGTVFDGGIRVPLIVSGPGVAKNAECQGLVNTTDLFATIVELAGADVVPPADSVSLVPYLSQPWRPSLRSWIYSETFRPNGVTDFRGWWRAARDNRYKLIWAYIDSPTPTIMFLFDMRFDPFEQVDLLASPLSPAQQAAYDELAGVMDALEP